MKFYNIPLNLKSINIKIRTISYWARFVSGKRTKFSNVFYRLSRKLNEHGDTNLNCVYVIKTILVRPSIEYASSVWDP